MAESSFPAEVVREFDHWMSISRQDLDAARFIHLASDEFHRAACSWAQQSGEKALKAAVYLANHIPPKIHNLRQIARYVDPKLQSALEQLDLELLTYWSIESRYPSVHLDINSSDAELAISIAHELFEIVQQHCCEILGRR